MAVLLPLEIWSQIASYIPDEELPKLITINHAFYEVGLNSRYRKLAVRYFNNETISKLQSLGDVTVARRVQDLELDTVAFDSLESGKNSRWKRLAVEFFHVMIARRRRAFDLTSITAKKTYELLFEAVKFMHNVHSLYFRVHPRGKSAREFLPMLTRLWLLLSRRVRTLTVHIPVDQTHIAFPIFTEVSLVQHLSIIVTTRALRWSGSWTVDSAIDVANFVNTMSENLTSLSLNLGTGASSELRFLLNNILPCDCMTSIDLHLPYDVVLGQDVARLLRQHARLLTDFTFTPSIASNVATSPLSLITVPNLRRLKLRLQHVSQCHFRPFWHGNLGFPSLTSLDIFGPWMMPDDISELCNAFRRSGFSEKIKHFELSLCLVDGQVFDLLSITFPCLHTLALYSKFLSPRDDGYNWDAEHFALEMHRRRYLLWSLHDITLMPPRRLPSLPVPNDAFVAMQAVSRSTPALYSFCGNLHMEFPQTSQMSPS